MARLTLAWLRALASAVPPGELAGALMRRARRSWRRAPRVALDGSAAADALGRAPPFFSREPIDGAAREFFADGVERSRRRAEKILAREVDVFGRACVLGAHIDWQRDWLTGRSYDADAPSQTLDVCAGGADPKGAWEPARAGHLVELGAAARVHPELAPAARAEIAAQIGSFLDGNRAGRGIHYASPLEVALRGAHWLAALELGGGARAFDRRFVERLGAALAGDVHFILTHLEDSGVVPANHLLADQVGVFVLGLALDAPAWWRPAARAIRREAARQVEPDGAHFEASTGYHRFALELFLVAHQAARAHGIALGVGGVARRMLGFVRGYLMPDGSEPAFGDGDDARLLPLVPRPPRAHGYLLSIGALRFGDPSLRAPDQPLAEETLLWIGPRAPDAWRRLGCAPDEPSRSFPGGGVHVLRAPGLCVAMRSGGYGQHGVGGHAHNDQLALVVHAAGRPLIVDAGTGGFTLDELVRDRFRGTAAHATLVVDGAEQSPLIPGRPFALPDRARAPRVRLDDDGRVARLDGEHRGYLRLPARVVHRRRLTLLRDEGVLLIEDELDGRGAVAVELRFPLAGLARLGVSASARARLRALGSLLGPFDPARALDLDGRALLVPGAASPLQPILGAAPFSPCYGSIERRELVSFRAVPTLPTVLKLALVRCDADG